MLFTTYFMAAKIQDSGKNIELLEEAAKISIIILLASSTGSIYKHLTQNKEDKHFRLHLLGTLIVNIVVAGSIYFTKNVIPPQAALEETNKTLFSTPYFMNIMANYLGDGAANIINKQFQIKDFKKRALSFLASTLPVIATNALFCLKFGKDTGSAINEVCAIAAFNFFVHTTDYLVNQKAEAEEEALLKIIN